MSHFLDVQTELKAAQYLVPSLKTVGFEVQVAMLGETAITAASLMNYEQRLDNLSAEALINNAIVYSNSYADTRTAHIVARHELLKGKRAPIGFLWNQETGTYELQCDLYEIRHSDFGSQRGDLGTDNEGKVRVETPYRRMATEESILTVLQQQLQMEYDRAFVRASYPSSQYIVTETRVDRSIQYQIKTKPQVNVGVALERV